MHDYMVYVRHRNADRFVAKIVDRWGEQVKVSTRNCPWNADLTTVDIRTESDSAARWLRGVFPHHCVLPH